MEYCSDTVYRAPWQHLWGQISVSSGFLCLSTAVLISGDEALYEDEAVSNLHPVEALLMTLQARKYELFLETGAKIWH